MTTHLKGKDTDYLPFNLGNNNGADNPTNPCGYRTAYLWERIWAKDSLMEVVDRFLHLQTKEIKIGDQIRKKEIMFFLAEKRRYTDRGVSGHFSRE
jgi:type I restriction enzyme R subunit